MRRILPITCVAFAFAVGLNAQTTAGSAQTSTSQKAHSSASKSGGKSVSLTGCLREGDTPGTYQLTNVDMSSMGAKSGKGSKPQSSTATSGGSTSGTESGSQAGMGSMGSTGTINLIAAGSVDLKEHVGHKVQVTGSWAKPGATGTSGSEASAMSGSEQSNPTGTGSTSGQSSAGQSGSKSGAGMSRELTVTSLKHIAESCQ